MGADNQAEKVIGVVEAVEEFTRDILARMHGKAPDGITVIETAREIRGILKSVRLPEHGQPIIPSWPRDGA